MWRSLPTSRPSGSYGVLAGIEMSSAATYIGSPSFDCFSYRSSCKTAIRKDAGAFSRFLFPARAPFGAELQQDQSSGKESACEKEKPPRILPGSLLDSSEKKRQEKASQAASRTDQSGENPNAFRESLRQELKNGSIAHAHHSHSEK